MYTKISTLIKSSPKIKPTTKDKITENAQTPKLCSVQLETISRINNKRGTRGTINNTKRDHDNYKHFHGNNQPFNTFIIKIKHQKGGLFTRVRP